jgi:hypothetical protein
LLNYGMWALVAAIMAASFALASWFTRRYYSRPHEFQFAGEAFIWIPDFENRYFGDKLYEVGTFQYADGTPVTDSATQRMLQDHWVRTRRRAELRVFQN